MNARSAKGKDANRATVIKYTRGMFVSFSWKQVICTSQLTKPYQQWGGGGGNGFFFVIQDVKKNFKSVNLHLIIKENRISEYWIKERGHTISFQL